jgi:hypothetical protein
MTIAPAKKLIRAKINARIKMLNGLCNRAREGDIKIFINDAHMATITWCKTITEGQYESYCLIHYRSTVDSTKINTAESQERMLTRIKEGDYIGGSSFAELIDMCIETNSAVIRQSTPKEQPS